uniref:Uncharacterized protein n=2 Tax=Avena sativa TaxID=4498 RepID=A0ACD5YCJ9_AVESA
MEEAPICALVDAMFRLPAKLDRLLARHGHMLPRGAEDEIPLIKQDLERMISILEEHVDLGAEDRAMMVNCMTKEVRELSYDMEDSVDQYEHAANTSRWILSPRRKKYKITRRRGKTAWRLPEKLKWRLWMANKIREFSVRSQEALQRYSLLNHPGGNGISSIAASTSTRCDLSFSSWHPTPYGEPVGIDASLKKIEAWLDKDGEQKLKVVSVVGSGGVGKTTLANELYRRIGGQFECRAFVRTSRKPDVRRLLISMLSQVWPHQTPHTWKVHSLISDIRTHLQDKRYLIVIDDIWDVQTWDIINRALPDGNLCSGILITTEVEDVALKCCGYDSKYIFAMKPLGHDDSSKLFFNAAFGPNYECAPELSEVANNIIRKCAGLPLATVIVASLLVRWMGNTEQWDYVTKSLGYGLRTNPTVDGMKQVLNLRYDNLPHHLKACLMYLSIYKEDYIIQKDDLVKQWISEGLILATEGKDNEEISRSYFDGLISSRMIQPVHINDNDDILSCAMHYMVLDLVREKSIEENFVTTIDHCQTTARVADKVRRLSLHFGNAEATLPTNMRLSQARTLAFFGVLKCLPSVVEFGLLQVLILHLWGDDDDDCISFDLTRISELFRLRYLHVKCNVALKVQKIQMRALQCLETLKIDARVSAVPSDITHLSGLLHLSLPIKTKFPNGIGNMTSLWTLGYFDLTVNSRENVQSLGELVNLRDLRLTCSAMSSCHLESKMESMGSILTRLSNLRSLTLEPSSIPDVGSSSMSISCDGLSIISSAPEFLRRFEWLPHICTFSSLPQWIRHLDKLCILKIGVTELVRNDVDVLRGLSALTVLSLYVRTNPVERIVFDKTGFMVLKYFNFRCSIPWLEFQVDAMPNLRNLGFDAHGANQHGTIPIGIEHLSGLKEISARIGGSGADDLDRMAVESALSYAFKFHPARPTFNIQCVDRMFTGKDDNIGGVQEKEHLTLQKQCAIMEEDSIEQHGLQSSSVSGEVKAERSAQGTEHTPKRKMLPKWSTQVRLSSLHDIKESDDGFSWMKYGQRDILGSKYPRDYYRCKHRLTQGCQAVKQLQRTNGDPLLFDATYFGNHICTQVANSLQSSVSGEVKAERSAQGTEHTPKRTRLKLSTQIIRRLQVRVKSMDDALDDGFSWRKYGQKRAVDSKYPRAYYRCTHKNFKGCPATRQVQRSSIDPLLFDVVYKGEHTCTYNALHLVDSISAGSKEPPATSESQITYGENSGSRAGVQFMPLAMSSSQVTTEAASGSGSTAGVRLMSPRTSNSQITTEAASGSGSTARFWSGALDEVDSIRDDDMPDPTR